MRAGNNGITADTVKNIQFGAGTIHKGLKYASETGWNFEESCVGATKGGSSVKIEPTFYTVEPDGSSVAVMNFKRKIGETATMEVNLLELNAEMLKASVIGADGESDVEGMALITSKDAIEEGDYWENIAFVGETLDNKNIIVILPNALCTSGLSIEGKSGEESVGKFTFECHGDANESLTTLPYKIYYPAEG
jgi:hypothetical protein